MLRKFKIEFLDPLVISFQQDIRISKSRIGNLPFASHNSGQVFIGDFRRCKTPASRSEDAIFKFIRSGYDILGGVLLTTVSRYAFGAFDGPQQEIQEIQLMAG